MILRTLVLVFFIVSLCSCQSDEDKLWLMETTEIFKAVNETEHEVHSELTYKDAKLYNAEGLLSEQWYYNKQGQVTTVEKFDYKKGASTADKSNFYSISDSLLSYYTFEYNDKKEKISSYAYDASNDDLLRIENYYYDENGNRTKREIKSNDQKLQATYRFTFDGDGNESSFEVFDPTDKSLYRETYSITKEDIEGRWTEMWSFQDTVPVNVKKRIFRKFTPEKR